MREFTQLKGCIQELKNQAVLDISIKAVDGIGSKNAFLIIFSTGDVLWTFHEWRVTHGDNDVIHSNSTDSNIVNSVIEKIKGKNVANVQMEFDTMRLFLFLCDNYKIEFLSSLLYEKRISLWFFKSHRKHKIFYVNSVSEIVIRDTFRGDEALLEEMDGRLLDLIGQQVCYSSAGGGNGSLLLLETQNKNCLWLWQYWEIWRGDVLLATSEDDDTPTTGKMAVASQQMNGNLIEDVILDDNTLDCTLLLTDELRLEVITTYAKKKRALRNWEYWIPKMNTCYEITSAMDIYVTTYKDP